jgi:competence protein ComFB
MESAGELFMKIKNYQEDIVIHALNVMMEDQPNLKGDQTFVNDVAAYVLNRMPPKYIMSERGFTRLAISHLIDNGNGEGLESLVELMALINNGIKVVKERRKPGNGSKECEEPCITMLDPSLIEYLHNFPQFIGMVIDKTSGKYVPNACVTLYIDGVKAVPAEPGWVNPYITNSLTKGAFSFWPKAVKDTTESKSFEIKITVEHEKYKSFTLEKAVTTKGAFRVYNFIDGESIINLEPCYLVPKSA